MNIKNVVVIGSGTMGSGIAAHLCNANIPVTLLDLKTEISEKARERIHKSRPPLLIDKSKINNIKVGNISDNFDVVVHLAAFKAAGESMLNPGKYAKNNIIGGLNLIESCVKNNIKNIFLNIFQ